MCDLPIIRIQTEIQVSNISWGKKIKAGNNGNNKKYENNQLELNSRPYYAHLYTCLIPRVN